jgi:hypothetical protein
MAWSAASYRRTLTGRLKQVPTVGMDVEASVPTEFKEAYANDESRRRLLCEEEDAGSDPGAPITSHGPPKPLTSAPAVPLGVPLQERHGASRGGMRAGRLNTQWHER